MKKEDFIARNAIRMLTALGASEMTQPELGAAAGMARFRTTETVEHLHAAGRIHISHWRMQGAYVRVFKAGAGVDAIKPSQAVHDRALLCGKILEQLATADMTVSSLLLAIPSTNKIMLRLSLRALHKAGQIHITNYVGHKRAFVLWRAGAGETVSRKSTAPHIAARAPAKSTNIPPPDPIMAALFGR